MLVVDDEPVSRRKLQLLLEQYGTCETADSGERALELICQAHAQTEPYALITMDIELPGIQGPEVVARIRQWERENAVGAPARIVMVTVMADVPTVMAALKTAATVTC
jgi:CheY-like chemotaxis protein